MNQKGLAFLYIILVIILIAIIVIGGFFYIKSSHPELIGNSNILSNTVTESTPCVKFNYPSDYKLNPTSSITTTQEVVEGVSQYGTAILNFQKNVPGVEAYGMTVFCAPSNWSNAQKSIAESNLDILNTTLSSDISSGKDPYKKNSVKYDLNLSKVNNLNINNLTATKITEVFYSQDDDLWNVKETIYVISNNYFYQFFNTGSSHDEVNIKNEMQQFEILFRSAVLTNPVSS